ncbi:GroES-like protein [Decorospora gaudefroyi]|uniref:GroES-like protein n=1 Tax=Decorospora gaudefroyi TaxID=184978 RepID=A0A6A5K9N6_9PLEO|nr:GroES-like protein [Decorospora gaudefroyi]
MSTLPNGRSKPSTMRATVWNGIPYQVTIKSVPKPRLQTSEDVVVRLTSAAICGSDLHIYRGINGSATPPWVLGHEGVGIVQEVGEAVQNVKPGDRVVVPALPEDGVLNLQDVPVLAGFGFGDEFGLRDGLQAEYIRVPQADVSLIPIPHYPSHELSYLMISDIWATAWTCLDFSGFQPGETVAVFGAGPVGLLCAYTALFRGAARVYIVDHVKRRLAKAKEIGAVPIDFTRGNAASQILKVEKLGVNRSCDCCGEECLNEELKPQQNAIINDMVSVTIPGGGMGQVGVYLAQTPAPGRPEADKIAPTLDFPMTAFWGKNLSLKAGIVNPVALAPQLVQLIMSGRVDLSWVVTSVIGLEEVPEAYRRFEKKLETKVVIRFKWEYDEWSVGNSASDRFKEEGGDNAGQALHNGVEHQKNGARKTSWKSLEDIESEL